MGKSHIKAKKPIIDGYQFDSGEEAEYYLHLKERDDVDAILVHPFFSLIEPFKITCQTCYGEGKVASPKTGNPIKCRRCDGTGWKERQSWTYTADFQVLYKNGKTEVIDVKGWINERFPLVRKMFEYQMGFELTVVQKKKGKWVRR